LHEGGIVADGVEAAADTVETEVRDDFIKGESVYRSCL
jgi:hypothetical protein